MTYPAKDEYPEFWLLLLLKVGSEPNRGARSWHLKLVTKIKSYKTACLVLKLYEMDFHEGVCYMF
jgi:hypothetical protein